MPDVTKFNTLTFDCYGTLIDWERGIHAELRPWLDRHGRRDLDDNTLLETFGTIEAACEAETPGKLYPEILAEVHRRLADKWGIKATAAEAAEFGQSVGRWPAFADSATSLQYLKRYYKLVILSNVDRASFARSNEKLRRRLRPHPHRPGHRLLQAQPAQFRVRAGRPGAHLRHQEGRHPAHRPEHLPRRGAGAQRRAWPRCGSTGASRSAAGAPPRHRRRRARSRRPTSRSPAWPISWSCIRPTFVANLREARPGACATQRGQAA